MFRCLDIETIYWNDNGEAYPSQVKSRYLNVCADARMQLLRLCRDNVLGMRIADWSRGYGYMDIWMIYETDQPSNLGQLPALGLSPPALQSFTSGPALLQV